MNTNNIIYTAISDNKDSLLDLSKFKHEFDAVAFVDNPEEIMSKGWELRKLAKFTSDKRFAGRRNAKIYKIMPTVFFPDIEYSLWVDGTHFPTMAIDDIIGRCLGDCDIAMFNHPLRNCIYAEGEELLRVHRDHPSLIKDQLSYYKEANYPINNGLVSNTVILRRHTEIIHQLELAWWEQICRYSSRDQLSLMFVAERFNVKVGIMPGDWLSNDMIPQHSQHLRALE